MEVGTNNFNSVPALAKFSIDVRLIPEVSAEEVSKVLKEAIERSGGKYKEEMTLNAYVVNENSEIVKVLIEALKELGLEAGKRLTTGGTDQRFYGDSGKDAVAFGPGLLENAHIPNEWIPIDHLYKAKEVYIKAIKKLT